jgi:prepilin-type N-terminal cleavage/methylation domain-containing protein
MKKILSLLQFTRATRGFTLIELLVVIGILGILAAALIATIDPFEQLKKANDANVKNTAVEFVNANIRYFTTHNAMAWTVDSTCSGGTVPTAATLGAAGETGCLTDLVNDGEIKAAFTTATGILTSILISGGTDSVTACYLPTSKSGQRDQNARYTASGALASPANSCLGAPSPANNATACYWCSL